MKTIATLAALAVLCVLVCWAFLAGKGAEPLAGLEPETPVHEEDAGHVPASLTAPAPRDVPGEVLVPREEAEDEAPSNASVRPEQRETVPGSEFHEVIGRILDEYSGAAIADFDVTLEKAGELIDVTQTDEDGAFQFSFQGFEEETFAVIVDPPFGWIVKNPRVPIDGFHVEGGAQIEFQAKKWPPEVAGDISGWLRAESGGFGEGATPRRNHLILDLVSTEHPPITRRGALEPALNAKGETYFTFVFKDVPAGEYNLTLSSLGNYRWEPTSVLVTPPASAVEFLRFDMDRALPLVFEVFDAESNEPVADFSARHIKQTNSEEHGVFLHTGPVEGEQFPIDMPFNWSVEADGYATAYGNESAFSEVDGKRVARVPLRKGWSTRFLVMGGMPHTRPLAGAEVLLDGEFIGKTGADGGLNVTRDKAPNEVEVRYFDWVLAKPIVLSEDFGVRARSNVTPVLMK